MARLSLVAIVGVVGLPILAAGGNHAAAVPAPQCAPSANVFVAMSGPDFRLRKHQEPTSGYNQWDGDASIGNGWDHRFMAGANGFIYFITSTGELRSHRWNGTGWADGGVSKLLATGWTSYDQATNRYRVTVDSNNHIYAVKSNGDLTSNAFDQTTQTLTTKVISTGWTKYDQVFAAGDGVLYARNPSIESGTLYRLRYDHLTNTWPQAETRVGAQWNGYKQLTSPGGDIIYGTFAGGETWWYRYLNDQNAWANSASGNYKERISTWTGVDEIAPAVDSCKLNTIAADIQCKPSANIFGSFTDNVLRLRPHAEPETGLTSWDGQSNIGGAWNDRFVGGTNGYKFIFRANGEVHRHQWTASGWADGGVSQRIATGWANWNTPELRYRITVDSNNHFYSVPTDGTLRRNVYDDAAKTWTEETLDTGWGKYNQVFAAGDGVLYARDANVNNGQLYRFHFDSKSHRWLDYATAISGGWNAYKQIVSPGADVFYGLAGLNVHWFRWDTVNKRLATSAEGTTQEHILWWANVSEIAVDIDTCKLTSPATVRRPLSRVPTTNAHR